MAIIEKSRGETNASWRSVPLLLVCALLALPTSAFAQSADPKNNFVQALAAFSLGLDGTFGDEGPAIRANLEAMGGRLEQWDATIRAYETAMKADLVGADPSLAARMHLALGGVYLDRTRIDDALRELGTAAKLNPTGADIHMMLGLTYSQLLGDSSAATRPLQQAAMLESGNPVRAYVLARHLLTIGEPQEAMKAFRVVQESQSARAAERRSAPVAAFLRLGLVPESAGVEPFFPPALYVEGFESLRRGDHARAIVQFRESAARDPLVVGPASDAEAMGRAATAFRDGSVAEALGHLETAIAREPSRAEPHRIRGLVLVADRQYARGADELSIAVRLNPRDERARLAMADALVKSEQLSPAEQTLKETIAALPASGGARYMLGRVYERQSRYPEAVRALEQAVAFHPLLGLNGIYQTIGALEAAQQNFDGALAAYGKRIDVHPNDAAGHQALGDTYAKLGRSDEALSEFAIALILSPGQTAPYVSMGQVYLGDGRYEESVEASRRALALDPQQKEARYTLAASLVRLGRTEEGARELQVFQRLQAEDAAEKSRQFELGALRREAAVATAAQDHQKAAGLLGKAARLDGNSPAAHLDLGLALTRAGQHADAIDSFTKAAALGSDYEVYRHLADSYAAAGRAEESQKARALYEQMKQQALRTAGARR